MPQRQIINLFLAFFLSLAFNWKLSIDSWLTEDILLKLHIFLTKLHALACACVTHFISFFIQIKIFAIHIRNVAGRYMSCEDRYRVSAFLVGRSSPRRRTSSCSLQIAPRVCYMYAIERSFTYYIRIYVTHDRIHTTIILVRAVNLFGSAREAFFRSSQNKILLSAVYLLLFIRTILSHFNQSLSSCV